MKWRAAGEGAFDFAILAAVVCLLGFVWTLDFTWLQGLATCGIFAAGVAFVIATNERPQPPKPQPEIWRKPPERDFVSQEEYDEGPIAP